MQFASIERLCGRETRRMIAHAFATPELMESRFYFWCLQNVCPRCRRPFRWDERLRQLTICSRSRWIAADLVDKYRNGWPWIERLIIEECPRARTVPPAGEGEPT